MPRGDSLGELEILVLLAAARIGPDAYGVTIRREIRDCAGRSLTPGTIYATLARLERKGLLQSRVGAPTAARGGRAKRHYAITEAGLEAARQAWRRIDRMAAGLGGEHDFGRRS